MRTEQINRECSIFAKEEHHLFVPEGRKKEERSIIIRENRAKKNNAQPLSPECRQTGTGLTRKCKRVENISVLPYVTAETGYPDAFY